MPSNYEEICRDNIRRRGEEFDDIGRLISEQLYSDRTHFIYELLQNAEDALGRRHRNNPENRLPDSVKFILYKNRLEFRHFGEEFNTDDVEGISDVLKGTKAEDRSQIGNFGIGFKSVYAFTSTPEIHSVDEHFVIERYIRPRSVDKFPKMTEGETVFIFPFNHENLSAEHAFHLIEEKLKKIGSRILLFLKNISEIEWKIEGQDEGQYLKESKQHSRLAQNVTVIGQHGDEDEEEEWLVFGCSVNIPNSSDENLIEVAFMLIEDEKTKKPTIRKIESSPLAVYFPTKLETRLGFLVQGPYDTTASRSEIEDNEWNRRLIKETATLLTEHVLPALKEMGLLTVSLLEALPIKVDDFPKNSIFRPIYNKCRASLHNQDLLPTANDKHVAGKYAVLARAEDLVHLLNSKQLSFLLNNSLKLEWLTTEITETRKDIHRYLVGWKLRYWETGEEIEPLIVTEIRPEIMIEKLTPDFLKEQSITWLLKLYAFFEKRPALIDELSNKPIIRLKNGTHVPPLKEDGSPNAYLPPEDDTKFPVVTPEITKDEKALKFLKKLRLDIPNTVDEVVVHIIPKYSRDIPPIFADEHQRDMKKILRAYSADSQKKKEQLANKLEKTAFVRAENLVVQQIEYKKPCELYLRNDDLLLYFYGNKDAWFVSSEYDSSFQDMFKDLGVTDEIRIRCKSKNGSAEYVQLEYKNGYRRGLKGFDPDIQVDGLEHTIMNPSTEGSKIIWNKIAVKYSHCIKGKVLRSSRQDFSPNASTYKKDEITSNFGHLLIDKAWLPSPDGSFVRPSELSLDDLPDSFIRDEKLADQLGMKKDVIAKLAEEAGVSVDDINLIKQLKEHPDEYEKVKVAILAKKEKPAFPEKASSNGDRSKEKITEKYHKAPKKKYEKKSLSKKTTENTIDPGTWLRETYTNKEGQMICQICQKEMPFKKRNGKYYFEAIELLNDFDREMEELHIALCPLCAAMYNEFVKHGEGTIESLKNALMNSEDTELPLQLGDLNTSVRFVERHFLDIRTIIEAQE